VIELKQNNIAVFKRVRRHTT